MHPWKSAGVGEVQISGADCMAHILSGKVTAEAPSRLAQPRLWTTRSTDAWHPQGPALFLSPPCLWKGLEIKGIQYRPDSVLKTPCKGAPNRSGGCQAATNPWRLKRCPGVLPTQPHYWKGSGPRRRFTRYNKDIVQVQCIF